MQEGDEAAISLPEARAGGMYPSDYTLTQWQCEPDLMKNCRSGSASSRSLPSIRLDIAPDTFRCLSKAVSFAISSAET